MILLYLHPSTLSANSASTMSLSPSHSINQTNPQAIFDSQASTAQRWKSSPPRERAERIKKINGWIRDNLKQIREALKSDFGKPEAETDLSEIYPVITEIKHTLKNLEKWMRPVGVSTPLTMLGTSGKIHLEPKGRSLIIAPWNYPFNLAIAPLVSALAAGCTAIIKPSELTPNSSALLENMIKELFDPSEVAVIQGEVDTSQELLKLPFDHIFFTGSPAVGKIVMKAAAEHLASVTLELGGKSPVIIDRNADLKDAAGKILWGKFVNCGQTCIAPDYILAHESILQELLMELKVGLQKMYDTEYKGIEHSHDYARIVNEKHFTRLLDYLTDAQNHGATLEFGGNTNLSTRFIEPTILTQVDDSMKVMQEEIFGPLLPIKTYQTLEEAISYINSKPKPLALYFFGRDKDNYETVIQETSSGNAVINDCVLHYSHPNLPFGGVNNSGIGKAHGYFGFLEFSNQKGVLKQRVGMTNLTLIRPPYDLKTKKLIASLIKWF